MPRRRDVPFFVDVGIALALTLTVAFFILVMEDRFGVTDLSPDQMSFDNNVVVVAHEPITNKDN
jgi:hypothetical protein